MKFKKFINLILENGATAFKSYEEALHYCKLLKKVGVKCKPIKVKNSSKGWNYWQIKYL